MSMFTAAALEALAKLGSTALQSSASPSTKKKGATCTPCAVNARVAAAKAAASSAGAR